MFVRVTLSSPYVGKRAAHVSRWQLYLYGFGNVAIAKSGLRKIIVRDTTRRDTSSCGGHGSLAMNWFKEGAVAGATWRGTFCPGRKLARSQLLLAKSQRRVG